MPEYIAVLVDLIPSLGRLEREASLGIGRCNAAVFGCASPIEGSDSRMFVLLPLVLLQGRLPYFVFLLANRTGYIVDRLVNLYKKLEKLFDIRSDIYGRRICTYDVYSHMQSQIPHLVVIITNVLKQSYQLLLFMSICFLKCKFNWLRTGLRARAGTVNTVRLLSMRCVRGAPCTLLHSA